LDRWSLSGFVYGVAEGINPWLNEWMYNRIKKPDVTLVFYGKSYKRSTTTDDSYEKDATLQAMVKDLYFTWAATHPKDHVLISNEWPIDEVHKRVLAELARLSIP
jgi:thymidylate kinase